jgi:integrase
MARVNLTAGRINSYLCPRGKQQDFLWDTDAPGLALRATRNGAKAFVFQAKLAGRTIRRTIGDPKAWSIEAARVEARRLQVLVDRGIDPRQEDADRLAEAAAKEEAEEAARVAAEIEARNAKLMVADAWQSYLRYQATRMPMAHIERGKKWSPRHMADHVNLSNKGGEPKKRGNGETVRGVLHPLLQLRMADVTAERLRAWQAEEARTRANNARQGYELFRAFWRWCASRPEYAPVTDLQAVESKELRDEVPNRKSKRDVLAREHLPAWFAAVRSLNNRVASAYLQALVLTGARREEMAALRWQDVDLQWGGMWVKDKVAEEGRKIPLTPYLASQLSALPRRSEWVFSSPASKNGRLAEPRIPHKRALSAAGIPSVTLHGLRRTFISLAEWVEMPTGVVAQIVGHAPSATAEKHYKVRPLDLLRMWHSKYEAWILEQAGIAFDAKTITKGLRVVA